MFFYMPAFHSFFWCRAPRGGGGGGGRKKYANKVNFTHTKIQRSGLLSHKRWREKNWRKVEWVYEEEEEEEEATAPFSSSLRKEEERKKEKLVET